MCLIVSVFIHYIHHSPQEMEESGRNHMETVLETMRQKEIDNAIDLKVEKEIQECKKRLSEDQTHAKEQKFRRMNAFCDS